jgi:hypothetical protein
MSKLELRHEDAVHVPAAPVVAEAGVLLLATHAW